jgi:hypothetical protein
VLPNATFFRPVNPFHHNSSGDGGGKKEETALDLRTGRDWRFDLSSRSSQSLMHRDLVWQVLPAIAIPCCML